MELKFYRHKNFGVKMKKEKKNLIKIEFDLLCTVCV